MLLTTAAASSAPAQAADDDDHTLSEVAVTAQQEQSLVEMTADPRLHGLQRPASDAGDFLKTMPGFSAIRSGGANGDPVFRGQFGSRLPMLTNGTTMLGACGSRMDAPSSYISPETFDQVTVVKGPQTMLWGPGASAGVVRFDRWPPTFDKPGATLTANLLAASRGRRDQMAEVEAGSSQMYFRGSAYHAEAGDYHDGKGRQIPSAWKKWHADMALGWTPDAHTLIELSAGAGDGHARYAARSMDGAQFRNESWALRLEKQHLTPVLSKLEAQLYANHTRHVMDNHSLRPTPLADESFKARSINVRRTTSGGRLAATLQPGERWQVVTGIDAQRSPLAWRVGTLSDPYSARPWNAEAKLSNVGWFGEASWQAFSRTRLVGGIRLDHAQARRYPAEPQDYRSRSALPSGFLRWEQGIAHEAQAYAGLGHVQRFPDYWELVPPANSASGQGNAFMTLQPEKTTQLDVGAHWKQDHWALRVSGFASLVQDYILFEQRGRSSTVRNVDAATAGFELDGQYQLSSSVSAQATLTGVWARNRTDGRPLPQIPPAELRLGMTYTEGRWKTGAQWRLVSRQSRVATGQGNAVGKDFGPSGGFGLLSVHATYRVHQNLKLMLGVDNLLNKTYAEHLNLAGYSGFGFAAGTRLNEPGRSAWLRANLQF